MTNSLNKMADWYNEKIYRIGSFAAVVIIFSLLIFRFLLIYTYNPEIGGIDNNFVYATIRSMAGYDIYSDPAEFPYAVNLYSPLYYNLCSLAGNIFNINFDDPINIYKLCRSASLLCDIATCFLFFGIIQKTIFPKKELLLLITTVFACILCYLGYTFCRVDSLFLTFYASTFYVLLSDRLKNHLLKNVVLALLTIACIFSKQNGIALPFLVALWLFINHSLKRSLVYLVIFIVLFSATFYLYSYSYSHLKEHIVDGLNNRIDFSWFYAKIFQRFADSLLIIPLYIATVISLLFSFKRSARERSLGFIFIFQTVFSLGASFKWGATPSYFYESYFLGLILIASYISKTDITSSSFSKKIVAWWLPLFLVFSFFVLVRGYLFYLQRQDVKKNIYEGQMAIRDYLAPKLDSTYVFNAGDQNGDFFKNLFYRQAVVPNYDAVSCCTFPDKTFDYSNLLNDLQSGKIGWLIMPENLFIKEEFGISLTNYKKDTSIHGHTIYKFQQ